MSGGPLTDLPQSILKENLGNMGNKNEGYLGGIMGGESRLESGGGGLKTTGILSLEEAGTQVVTPSDTANASDLSLTDGLTLVSGAEVDHTAGSNSYEDAYITLPTGSGYVYAEVHMYATDESNIHQVVGLIKSASVDTNNFGHTTPANAVTVRRSSTSYYRHVGGTTEVPQTVSGRAAVNTYHFLVNRDNGNVWIGITPDGSTTRWIRSDDTMNATWSSSHPTFVGLNLSTYDTFYFQQYYTTQSAWVNFGGNPLFNGQLSSGNDSGNWFKDPDASVSAASLGSEAATGPAETRTLPQLSWGGITGRSVLTEGSAAVPGDDDWNNVSLLIRGDTLTDLSANGHTPAVNSGAAAGDSTQYKYSTSGSMSFGGGQSDYISIPDDTSLEFGSGDFTVECWAYYDGSMPASSYIFLAGKTAQDTSTSRSPFAFGTHLTSGGAAPMRLLVSTGSSYTTAQDTANFPINQWVHLAGTRSGNTITLWVNGVAKASASVSGTLNANSDPVLIGTFSQTPPANNALHWNGNVEDFRITQGIARYTSDFTPPTASFPASLPVAATPGTLVDTGIFTLEEIYELNKST